METEALAHLRGPLTPVTCEGSGHWEAHHSRGVSGVQELRRQAGCLARLLAPSSWLHHWGRITEFSGQEVIYVIDMVVSISLGCCAGGMIPASACFKAWHCRKNSVHASSSYCLFNKYLHVETGQHIAHETVCFNPLFCTCSVPPASAFLEISTLPLNKMRRRPEAERQHRDRDRMGGGSSREEGATVVGAGRQAGRCQVRQSHVSPPPTPGLKLGRASLLFISN